ncbi:hypothetical protein ACWFMI_09225 [Nocardiopsis terrae]
MIVQPFPDVEDLVAEHLRSRVPDFPSAWAGTPVATASFPDRSPGEEPTLTVRCEESTGNYPITQQTLLRVSAWADTRDDAKALGHLAHAALLEHAGDADIVSVRQVDGVIAGFDPEVPEPHATFTVLVTQRPS